MEHFPVVQQIMAMLGQSEIRQFPSHGSLRVVDQGDGPLSFDRALEFHGPDVGDAV